MKKALLLAVSAGLVLMLVVGAGYAQPMGPGMMGPGYGYGSPPDDNWNYCPYCGSYMGGMMGRGYGGGYGMMGPGMMGRGYGGGYGMMGPGMMGGMMGHGGYGMMGPGYGYGPGSQYGYGPQIRQPSEPLDKEDVTQMVEGYLKSTRNPNLKMGAIEDKGNDYEVNIETKDGKLVDKILVSKDTGWMRSAY